MGGGSYSNSVYQATRTANAAAGRSTFHYSDTMRASRPASSWAAHADLDPKGMTVRESRDSDEHPTSTAIAVIFDVTGSMSKVPVTVQDKLNTLYGLLLRKGYADHPQIVFGAVGDALSDRVPFQIGQFESDNRGDEQLRNIFLEGNGGGQFSESYELALYFLARKTSTDCFEKRGEKGVAFLLGDEKARNLDPATVRKVFGDEIDEPIALADLVDEVQQKWDLFFIIPQGGVTFHGDDPNLVAYWRDLFGERTLLLDDPENVAELIALTVGLTTGAVDDLDTGLDDLDAVGAGAAKGSVGKALAHVGGQGAVATGDDLDGLGGTGVGRL